MGYFTFGYSGKIGLRSSTNGEKICG